MKSPQDVADEVMSLLDREVRDLSRDDYAEVLDILGSDIEARQDCVREESEDID